MLVIAAVAATVAKWGQNNVVSIFLQEERIDLSLNLCMLGLGLAFLLFYILLRLLESLFTLPARASQWREQQQAMAAFRAMQVAMAHHYSGRFVKARKALKPMFAYAPSRILGHFMAAEAAHAVQFKSKFNEHVKSIRTLLGQGSSGASLALSPGSSKGKSSPQTSQWQEALLLQEAAWSLSAHDAGQAMQLLQQLPQGAARRTLALRTKLHSAQMLGHSKVALETARMLARHGAFGDLGGESVLRKLMLDSLLQAKDLEQLRKAWREFPRNDRVQVVLVCRMAQRLVHFSRNSDESIKIAAMAEAREILTPLWRRYEGLSPGEKDQFIYAFSQCLYRLDAHWLRAIESTQHDNPADPKLQYLAGCAADACQLWGKAKGWLNMALPRLQDPLLLQQTWVLLAHIAEQEGDNSTALTLWRAAAQSKSS